MVTMFALKQNQFSSPFFSIHIYSILLEYDWRANTLLRSANQFLDMEDSSKPWVLDEVRTCKTYYLNRVYSHEQLERIAKHLLCDPVIERYSLNGFGDDLCSNDFQYVVEISYLPGMVDSEGRTFMSAIKDYLKEDFSPQTHTASGFIYLLRFQSSVSEERVKKFFTSLLVNPLIERIEVVSVDSQKNWKDTSSLFTDFFQEYTSSDKGYSPYEVIPITLLKDDLSLNKLSRDRLLYLSPEEMRTISNYYLTSEVSNRRLNLGLPQEPTDVELEAIAQTWSEHCKHKIFAAEISYHEEGILKETIDSLYQTYIKKTTAEIQKTNTHLLSVFSDNSGVFRFTEDMAVCMKVETHNSPSALDPFGGAITGIVGVNRDIIGTGMGAQPLFNTDVFCFGYPDYSGPVPPNLFHPLRVMQGVHHGVERGGNESGIPTVNGAMVFDNRFIGKPLVFCGTGGIIPIQIRSQSENGKRIVDAVKKHIQPGDLIAMVGGRIGKDGIHGATFSSTALDNTQPVSVVQIGDPIVQKKMTDFLIVARDNLLYRTLTDNGAGGLSSSIGEMALFSNGCQIELDKALLKYSSLKPWEILVSESQERMTLALPPENREKLESLASEYDVEICFIGKFTQDGFFTANYNGKTVAHLDLTFLHEGLPQMRLKANWVKPVHRDPTPKEVIGSFMNYGNVLRELLARPNIASKENWVRRYDHEVKALTILKPFDGYGRDAPMDAAVLKPLRSSEQGLIISNGICSKLSDIDSYAMAAMGVDEAVRNAVVSGADPGEMYALDNFCWPDPITSPNNLDGEYKLAQLVRANKALRDVCSVYHLPLISGKDSMKNDYGQGKDKVSVPPTLLVSLLSVIPDYRKICSTNFKRFGSSVYLLGKFDGRMGGSEFYASRGWVGSDPPQIDPEENLKIYRGLYQSIQKGWVLAAHDVSDGGLAVSLAECCFGSRGGVEINLSVIEDGEPWRKLFCEPAGTIVVEVDVEDEEEFLDLFRDYSSRICRIGNTIPEPRIRVMDASNDQEFLIDEDVIDLKSIWRESLAFD